MIQVFRREALKLFSLITMAALAIGCCKENTLPEATTEGKGTFGMLINDTIWEPFQPGLFTPGNRKPELYFYKDLNLLEIYANNWSVKQKLKMTVENVFAEGDFEISRYSPLVLSMFPDSIPRYYDLCVDSTRFELNYNCTASYKLLEQGKSRINISYFDTISKIVSGTFELELTNPKGESIKIKQGVFDSYYSEE